MPLPGYKRRYRARAKKRFDVKRRKYKYKKALKRAWSKPLKSVRIGRGFPDKMTINHKLSYTTRINALNDLLGNTIIVKANSMFAPITVAGINQNNAPLLKDQMEPIYNHYVILGSKIHFRVCYDNNSASNVDAIIPKGPVEWVVLRNDSTSTSPVGTMRAIREQNGVQHRVLPGTHVHSATSLTSARMSYSVTRVFGKNPLDNSRLQCTGASGDPGEGYYYLFYIRNTGTENVPVTVFIDVEYSAVWFERADIASSTDTPV